MSTGCEEAAFEALENHWPFSSLETRQVRYWGDIMDISGSDIKFTSIQQIREHRFIGNHAQDSKAFNAIEQFVRNSENVDEQYEALDLMGINGMGLEPMDIAEDTKRWSKQECVDRFLAM